MTLDIIQIYSTEGFLTTMFLHKFVQKISCQKSLFHHFSWAGDHEYFVGLLQTMFLCQFGQNPINSEDIQSEYLSWAGDLGH